MAFGNEPGNRQDPDYNHGVVTTKQGRFTTLQAYGKDDSNWVGSASDERVPKVGGGTTDIGHSIAGGKAHQSNP